MPKTNFCRVHAPHPDMKPKSDPIKPERWAAPKGVTRALCGGRSGQ